jgi:hemolysin activation/secretion protein
VSNRRTRNYFLGQPSVFVPGAPDGVTTVSALRLGLDWVGRSTERVVALRGLVSFGLDAMGASVASAPGIADSKFTSMLVQGQWIERLGTRGTLVARAENQQSNDSLLGPERYALGGMDSVRGYRKDVQIRDSGWFSSIEYRQRAQANMDGALQLAVFADAGRGRLRNDPAPGPGYLASIGAGARWEPYAGVQLHIYYGDALHPVRTPTSTLADNGWHLRLTYVTSF